MGDAAIAVGRQEDHLAFPSVGVEGPAVAEHHWLSLAPVFVIDLRTVFCRNCAHTKVTSVVCYRLTAWLHQPRFSAAKSQQISLSSTAAT